MEKGKGGRRYSRPEPNAKALFWKIKKFYAEEELCRRFYPRLHKELLGMYKRKTDVDKVVSLLLEGRTQIHNIETFFDIKVKRYNSPVHLGGYVDKELARLETLRELGASYIDATNLIIGLVLQNFRSKEYDLTTSRIEPHICKLMTRTRDGSTPYFIRLYDTKTILENLEVKKNKFTFAAYKNLIIKMFNLFDKYKELGYTVPKVELVFPLVKDTRINLLQTIRRSVLVPATHSGELFTKLKQNEAFTDDLEVVEKFLTDYQLTRNVSIQGSIDDVMRNLEYVKENNKYSSFSGDNFFKNLSYPHYKELAELGIFKREEVSHKFVLKEDLKDALDPVIVEISHDCTGISEYKELEEVISTLAHICILRKMLTCTNSEVATDGILKINLVNISSLKEEFIEKIRKKEKTLRSISNNNIRICIEVTKERASQASGFELPKYLRVISDMHIDVNGREGYKFNFKDDFVLNCGDTSGNATSTFLWNRANVPRGAYVYGNHLGYDSAYPREDLDVERNLKKFGVHLHKFNSLTNQIKTLVEGSNNIDGTNGPAFLNGTFLEAYGINIIGAILSTDFTLFGEEKAELCEHVASKSMNDFRRKYTFNRGSDRLRLFTTADYIKDFKRSIRWINIWINNIKDKGLPIVVCTHHAPTPHALAERYQYDLLSAAFVNDLRQFVEKRPEIRMWCFGHTHTPFDYIYKGCRFICEPFGYFNENKFKPLEYGKRVKLEDIKSEKSWEEILEKEIKAGLVKVYDE